MGFVLHFARAYPRRSAVMVGLLILSGLAEGFGIVALLPVLEVAVDGNAEQNPITRVLVSIGLEPTLGVLLATIVVAISLKAAFRWMAMRQVGYTIARVGRDLRFRLLRALMSVRWTYFASQPSGYFANAVSTESYRAAMAYKRACAALAGLIQSLVYAVVIVAISWKVAAGALAIGLLVSVVLGRFVQLGRSAGQSHTVVMKTLVARLNDSLQGIKSIKAMGRESLVLPLLERDAEELEDTERRQVIALESLNTFQEPIIVLIIAGGLFVILSTGIMSFSAVLVLVFLFYRLTGRLHFVQREYQGCALGESAFWSLDGLASLAEDQRESTRYGREPPALESEMSFVGVSFSYGEGPVLTDLDLSVPAGAFVALVGPSGSGKTTIVDLMIGLLRPNSGQVTVDGIDLGEVDISEWRHRIGYVPQDTLLFHDTVYKNVALGNLETGRDVVEAALRSADAWDFVSSLPDGLDTVVGERGSKLSGGQRQRIAIARALIGGPRLLILDEATTALDPQTEASICRTLARLRGQVTVVAISHQAAMRGVADIVYELAGGSVDRIEHEDPAPDRALRA